MNKTIVSLILLSSLSFAAAPSNKKIRIFECNVSSGDFQAVHVYQEGSRLTLATLNSSGSFKEYNLPAKQWSDKKIAIPCPQYAGNCGSVYFDRGDWVYKLGYPGYYDIGICH